MAKCELCRIDLPDRPSGKGGRSRKYCGSCSRQAQQGRDVPVQLICEQCGLAFISLSEKWHHRRFCSRSCGAIFTQRRKKVPARLCPICGIRFEPHSWKVFCCSTVCGHKYQASRRQRNPHIYICHQCGEQFVRDKSGRKLFCGRPCYYAYIWAHGKKPLVEVVAPGSGTRPVALYSPVGDGIRTRIFCRDSFLCKLCGSRTLRSKKVPHPRAPTIDHIIPRSLGGSNAETNLQTACFECNSLKSAKPLGQLRMF
jgi:hypothetical protein